MTSVSAGWRKLILAPSHVKIVVLLSFFSSLFLVRTLLTNHELQSDSSFIVTSVSETSESSIAPQFTVPTPVPTLISTPTSYVDDEPLPPPPAEPEAPEEIVNDIIDATNNGTLGFGKIFYISLP